MKIFTRPYWIAVMVTLPQMLIFFYYMAIYGVVSSLLNPENLRYWYLYGGVLGGMVLCASAYGIYLQLHSKPIPWPYAALTLLGYIAFLMAYFEGLGHLLPADLPRWMISADEFFLLPLGLMMPALIHALLLLVDRLTPPGNHSLLKATVMAVCVPAFWYLTVRFVFPLLDNKLNWRLYNHLLEVFFILLTVAFMFLLLRLAYLLILKITPSRAKGIWLVRVPFTLLLPLLCLLVYNGQLGGDLGKVSAELQWIGDWSHPVYYGAVMIIGLLLTLPSPQQKQMRLVKFVAMTLTYPFVSYFFIVFLPFFPFAVVTVVVFGAGFLLLTPLLLFFIQTWTLHGEWQALARHYGKRLPTILFLTACALLPVGMTVNYAMDRVTLDKMLVHVYEPDYTVESPIELNPISVQRVLNNIKMMKEGANFESGKRKPYLTSYYQWLVLDNLTLSNSRIEMLEQVFLGKSSSPEKQQNARDVSSAGVAITDANTRTVLSDDGRYYISSVDLTITNSEGGNREYATRFHLPPGAWVRDYYLMIDDKRVPGILAERKSALWIYQQIRDTRRDPGIIYYTSPDELILRVFPFAAGEVRKTGLEIIHREPLSLTLDGKRIELHSPLPLKNAPGTDANNAIVLVTPAEKQALPKIRRTPYLHFIIDRSASADRSLARIIERVRQQQKAGQVHGVGMDGAMITLANYENQTFLMDAQWQDKVQNLAPQGGFFLERAVKQALVSNYRQHANRYPLFVVVTDQIADAITSEGFADFAITMPEGDQFLLLTNEGLSVRRFAAPALEVFSQSFAPAARQVLAWPDDQQPRAYLPDDDRASVVLQDLDIAKSISEGEGDHWQNGLNLYGRWLASRLYPHQAMQKQRLIAESFRTHLLLPMTAFLAPENEAQQQMLLNKQEKMLSSMRQLDIGEEHEMDEPALWWLLLPLLAMRMLRSRAGLRSLWSGRCAVNHVVQVNV